MGTQNTGRRDPLMNQVRFFNKRVTNQITMRFAGKHIYAVVHHTGRASGALHQTPVLAIRVEKGFVIPLPYGTDVDWCRNVFAAGGCELDWQGLHFVLENPQYITPKDALPAFPALTQRLLRQTHVFLHLTQSGPPRVRAGQAIRKILVFGAGVLGSVYAGKLHQAGYEVTLLARGKRAEELRENGLVLVEALTGREEHIPVKVTDRLAPDEAYDLALVVTRKNQLASALPILAENHCVPNVLFLINNAAGSQELVDALGKERVLLGFPGGGGQRENGVVRYQLSPRRGQPTTIGELNGETTSRIQAIAAMFESAGLPAAICGNMDAWLKTHVAVIAPMADALYLAGGSNYRLAGTRDGLVLLVRAVREGFQVLRDLRIPITPPRLRVLEWLPEPLLVAYLRRGLATPSAELALARHANAARDEMAQLNHEFHELAHRSGRATPAIDRLAAYLDPAQPPLPAGQSALPLDWRPTTKAALLAAAMLAAIWVALRKTKPVR